MKSLTRKLIALAIMSMVAGILTVTSAPAASAVSSDCGYPDLYYKPDEPTANPQTGRVVDDGSADFRFEPGRVVYYPINGYTMTYAQADIHKRDESRSRTEYGFDRSTQERSFALASDEYLKSILLTTDKPGCPQPGGGGTGNCTGGYWLLGRDGGVFSFGDAEFHGSTGAMRLNSPVNGITPTPSGKGYWFVAGDGGVFSFGDARFWGSTGAMTLNQPVVGMSRTPSGKGYWLVARDGGIFSFGDAVFHGSTGAVHLNQPIVGMTTTPSGNGYWLLAADGGMFAFGDAGFHGSLPQIVGRNPSPAVRMVATPSGDGYWIVTADGRVYTFGDAQQFGDNPSTRAPMAAFAVIKSGNGYYEANILGDVFTFGVACPLGSLSDQGVVLSSDRPIVGMATTPSS
jgi:hypothetical protein